MTQSAPAIEMRDVSRAFGAVQALDRVSLRVEQGTLHMLLGENGAGKTTLLRIAAGLDRADSGRVIVGGAALSGLRGRPIRTQGIAVVSQHFSLVPTMTVAENIALARRGTIRRFSPSRAAPEAIEAAQRTGLAIDPDARVNGLSAASQQRVELVKAIATDPRIIMLDEPTAVLDPPDAEKLFAWLRRFVSGGGTAVVITHRLREAMTYGDSITVLRRGRIARITDASVPSETEVVTAMVGEVPVFRVSTPSRSAGPAAASAPVVLSAAGVTVTRAGIATLRDVTLEVRRGEMVGVAGFEGAGQADLLRLFTGMVTPSRGVVVAPEHVGFIPEHRHRDAMIGEMSLRENFRLRDAGDLRGVIDWRETDARTRNAIVTFDIPASDVHAAAATLSGGNQQRLVLARELDGDPPAIIAENPTRGLDVRGARIVHDRLREGCTRGAAVLWYSSNAEELIEFSDRVVACHRGTLREVAPTLPAIAAAMVAAE